VVVGADLEPETLSISPSRSREDQDRNVADGRITEVVAQVAAHFEAVHAGQHQVQEHQVRGFSRTISSSRLPSLHRRTAWPARLKL
jgi:hypothetical protein